MEKNPLLPQQKVVHIPRMHHLIIDNHKEHVLKNQKLNQHIQQKPNHIEIVLQLIVNKEKGKRKKVFLRKH